MSDTIHFDGVPHLSVAEAAARAGLSISYIRELLRRGEIKVRGAGEKKYVDERSLNTFLVEREYRREIKRQELSRKRTEEYMRSFAAVTAASPEREAHSMRPQVNERSVMDWSSLRVSFFDRTIALTLAVMMTIGTYAFVDQQSARQNFGLMQEGLQDVVDTLASVGETSKRITADPSQSLAAAASSFPGWLANFAKAFNTQVNSLVYGAAFPENVTDSNASVPAEIQSYARVTSEQPNTDYQQPLSNDQQPTLVTSASTPTTIINNPVIERTIERVVETKTVASAGGLTEEYLADKLGQLDNKLSSQMLALSSANSTAITQTYSVVSQTNKIDQLTNTDISSPRISGGTLTNAEISGGTISGTSISGGAVSATTLSAGETTISGSLTLGENLHFSSSSSTFSSLLASTTNLLATSATSTYLFATAATSTSFFATVASSTNLYSQSASLGSLSLSGLGTFSSGFLSLASTTIGNGSEDGGLTIFGGATTTGNAYFAGGLGVGIATTTAGAFQTAGNAHIGGNLLVAGDSTVLGASSADSLSIQSSITSDIVPNQNITYDLGSASFFWENIYVGTVVANNLSAASSTIAGTSAATFTINSDNVSSDAEDADLIFFRGNVVPNALISWKSGTQRFELNQAAYISNLSGSTTQPTLRLQGVAGQTGNLFEIASSTGTTMFSVDASGATLGNGFLSQASSTVVGDFTATGNATFGGTFSTGTTSLNNLSVTNTSTSTFAGGVSLAALAASGAATLGSTLSVVGDTTLASATSTTFFATTASSTNLFAQTTSFGALALPSFAQNRVPYFGAAGAITSGSGLTYDGTTLTAGNLTSSGAVSLGFATSTTFFAITASSTNFFAQTASLGALSVLGTTVHSGATTLSSALTYGGVTLANAVTGTGSMVLSSSPTLTGTMLGSAATLSSTLTMSGSAANIALGSNWLSGDGDDEGITINSSGEVGVGVAPEAGKQLTVTGDARFNGSVFLNGAAGVDPILWMDQFAGPTTVVINTDGDSYLTGGNLGIGQPNPISKLMVESSDDNGLSISNDTLAGTLGSPAQAGLYFAQYLTKVAAIKADTYGNGRIQFFNNSDFSTAKMTIDATGNVGIGTTTPASKLDVFAASTPYLRVDDGARFVNLGIDTADTTNSAFINSGNGMRFLTNSGVTTALTIISGGNVGIGTTTPFATLAANRNVSDGAYNLYLDQSLATWLTGAQFNSYRFIQTNSAATDGNFKAFHVGAGGVAIGYATTPEYGSSDALYVNGNVGIGTTTPNLKLTVNGSAAFGSQSGGTYNSNTRIVSHDQFPTFGFYQGDTVKTQLVADVPNQIVYLDAPGSFRVRDTINGGNTRLLVDGATGNVGIGTESPSARLAVGSPGNANSAIFGNGGGSTNDGIYGYITGTGRAVVGDSSGSGGTGVAGYSGSGYGGYFTSNSGPALVTGAGNVGIGTTTPMNTLSVAGSASVINFTGNAWMTLWGNSGAYGFTRLQSGSSLWDVAVRDDEYSAALQFRPSGGTPTLVLQPGGNVGIGTTNPDSKLHVDGYLNISSAASSSFKKVGGSRGILLTNSDDMEWINSLSGNGYGFRLYGSDPGGGTDLRIAGRANSATFTDILTIKDSGNVGIGTTTPPHKLSVDGGEMAVYGSGSGGYLRTFNTGATNVYTLYGNDSTGGQIYQGADGKAFRIFTNNAERLTIASNGNTTIAGSGTTCVIGSGTGATNCTSDVRLKTNVAEVSGDEALQKLSLIRGVTFNWLDPSKDQDQRLGVIAQEVQTAFPQVVGTATTTLNGVEGSYLTVDYAALVSPIISAINALLSKVNALASVVAGFADSFATKELTFVRATGDEITVKKLCLEDLCISKAKLQALLEERNISASSADSSSGNSSGSDDTATSTPDTTPPVITLNGANPALIEIGSVYSDLGAIVTDDVDQNLGYRVSLNGATSTDPSALALDTSTSTTHTITYSATDQAGNEAQASRTVVVGGEDAGE